MHPPAWELIVRMKGADLAGFLGLVGCLALVIAGIPTLMGGWGKSAKQNALATLRFVDGTLLVLGPSILLAPLFKLSSRAAIFAGLLYVSMLLVRLFLQGSEKPRDVVFRVLGPWILGTGSSLVSWFLVGAPQFANTMINILFEIALISYISFWIAFPVFFFASSSAAEQKARFKQIPALYVFGLLVIAVAEILGFYTCWHAWMASRPGYSTPVAGIVTLVAVGVQVGTEVRGEVRRYREMRG